MPEYRRTALRRRTVRLGDQRTSLKLEPEFWGFLEREARRRHMHLCDLVWSLDMDRKRGGLGDGSLASAARIWCLLEAQRRQAEAEARLETVRRRAAA